MEKAFHLSIRLWFLLHRGCSFRRLSLTSTPQAYLSTRGLPPHVVFTLKVQGIDPLTGNLCPAWLGWVLLSVHWSQCVSTEDPPEHPFRTVCPDTVSWKVSEHPSACSYRPLAEVTEHSQCSTRSEHSQCSTQSEHLLMVPVSLRLLFPKIESYLLSAGYPEGSLRCLGLL